MSPLVLSELWSGKDEGAFDIACDSECTLEVFGTVCELLDLTDTVKYDKKKECT